MSGVLINVGKKTVVLFLCAVILLVMSSLALSMAFPVGGGHFHAIFAYTDEGRLEPALIAYAWGVGVLTLTAMLLLLLRYPLSWAIALVASLIGLRDWWSVCSWIPQSSHFHRVALLLLPLIPAVIFYGCAALTWCRLVTHLHRSHVA